MVFFVIGGIQSLLIRMQLAGPDQDLLSPEAFNQLFTMHGITMMFLFAMPVLSGFGNFFVPLMIGAETVYGRLPLARREAEGFGEDQRAAGGRGGV